MDQGDALVIYFDRALVLWRLTEVAKANLTVAGHVKQVVHTAKGLLFNIGFNFVLLLLLIVQLFNAVKVEVVLIGVQSLIIVLCRSLRPTRLGVSVSLLIQHSAGDVEASY